MIWPCNNDLGIVKVYWDDQKMADASAYSFARVLEKLINWRNSEKYNSLENLGQKRINMLAHSMSNRALRETLNAWHRYGLPEDVPLIFRKTFITT